MTGTEDGQLLGKFVGQVGNNVGDSEGFAVVGA